MKQLFYIRHGESKINVGDTWATKPGAKGDTGLTEAGVAQATAGGRKAKAVGIAPDLIVCSPSVRTRETAAIVARELGYPLDKIIYDERFLEVQVGELEGTSFSKFIENYSYADLGKFEGAETIEMLQKRAAEALEYLKTLPEEKILVVSHSCFGRAFKRNIEGRPYTDEFSPDTKPLPFGEVIQLI